MRDYHIHTKLCKHAYGEMEEYVEAAIEKGFDEICFTDHIPFPDNFDISHRMDPEDIEPYLEWIDDCRSKYPEISILKGLEADYLEQFEDYLGEFLQKYSFDLVIMAIHFVEKWPAGNWVFHYDFPDKTFKEIYGEYLGTINQGVNSGLFDVVGHLDLVKRVGHRVMETNGDDMETLFDSVLKQGMGIEINTSGFRRVIAEPYPSFEVVEAAANRGIPITLGSDAHLPEQVGHEFPQVMKKISGFQKLKISLPPKALARR